VFASIIMMVGVLAGIYSSLFWQTRILGVIVLLLMLSIEVVLNYFPPGNKPPKFWNTFRMNKARGRVFPVP
jgi:hypothetical protein